MSKRRDLINERLVLNSSTPFQWYCVEPDSNEVKIYDARRGYSVLGRGVPEYLQQSAPNERNDA